MRQLVTLAFLAAAAGIVPSLAFADAVKGGRQYTLEQREIIKAKKELVNKQQDVAEFAGLLAEIDDLRMPRRMSDFWPVNREIRSTMVHEYAQAPEASVERMKAVIRESHGLQYVMADGDMDVFPRYRHLLGEFLHLMQDEEKAAADEIRRREANWE